MKIAVLTQPKAGTYLMANILKELGFRATNIHLDNTMQQYWEYTGDASFDRSKHPSEFVKPCNPVELLSTVNDGSFFVGHIPKSQKSVDLLKDFHKVIVFRSLEGCLLSMYRWRIKSDRHYNAEYSKHPLGASGFGIYLSSMYAGQDVSNWYKMLNWQHTDGTVLWFEDIKDMNIDFDVFRFQLDLSHGITDIKQAFKRAMDSDSQTKVAPDNIEYWNSDNVTILKQLKHG